MTTNADTPNGHTGNVNRKTPSLATDRRSSALVHINSDELLLQVSKELEQQVPQSYPILLPIRCHQAGELLQDLCEFHVVAADVDQWPAANTYVAILKREYYSNFETPPYQIVHFYSRTNDPDVIQRTFNSLPLDWSVPVLVSPGASKQQADIIGEVFKQHAGILVTHEEPRKFFSVASTTDMKPPLPVPDSYEFVRLKSEDVPEIFETWGFANNPFVVEDFATLAKRLPFGGIREKSTGKLIAYGGQLHCGTSACNRVDPAHRGQKLFQVILSRLMAGCVERYGFATADILETNAPSIAAFRNLGFKHQEGHIVYWLYMHPSASGPCKVKW